MKCRSDYRLNFRARKQCNALVCPLSKMRTTLSAHHMVMADPILPIESSPYEVDAQRDRG
jgi:hypothetical protein